MGEYCEYSDDRSAAGYPIRCQGSHFVEVTADTLYEAVAMAVVEFKQDTTVSNAPVGGHPLSEPASRSLQPAHPAALQSSQIFLSRNESSLISVLT
jgi:hypothetical protein